MKSDLPVYTMNLINEWDPCGGPVGRSMIRDYLFRGWKQITLIDACEWFLRGYKRALADPMWLWDEGTTRCWLINMLFEKVNHRPIITGLPEWKEVFTEYNKGDWDYYYDDEHFTKIRKFCRLIVKNYENVTCE